MTFKEQIEAIEQDLQGKLYRRDWHGVMDCAADLRELEAKEKGRQEGLVYASERGYIELV
jgi:hypothetical protein